MSTAELKARARNAARFEAEFRSRLVICGIWAAMPPAARRNWRQAIEIIIRSAFPAHRVNLGEFDRGLAAASGKSRNQRRAR